jgi:hypothetical protein
VKALSLLLIFCGIFSISDAQIIGDSLTQKASSTLNQSNIDSIQQNLLPSFHEIDAIRNNFNLAADSILTEYQKSISKIHDETNKVNRSIDSLRRLNLPADKCIRRLDSLSNLRHNTESKFTFRLNELKVKTSDKLNSFDFPPEYKGPLQALIKNVNDIGFESNVIKIPELKIPGYTISKIEGVGDLASKIDDIGKLNNVGKLPDIETSVGDLGKVAQQAGAYQEDVKNITQGNLRDVQELPETIEEQAMKVNGMNEIQKQSGLIDEQKAQFEQLGDSKNAKEKVTEVARKAAVNHFAGKEEQLKSAMEKISKYKQKYSSVSSIRDLPKRPPNPMKSKPFIERLVPGLYFQYQQKNLYLVDVNPYLGYRLTGKITTGLGWNHRYAFNKDNATFDSRSRIFGPRSYVDFKLGKGFIAHLEGESMNSFIPSTLRGNPDTGQREWVWSFMTGLKKEYKIYKNLKGTALIQYNWFNRYYMAPYVDRLNSRIGFEYRIKKQSGKGKRQQAVKAHSGPAKAQVAD